MFTSLLMYFRTRCRELFHADFGCGRRRYRGVIAVYKTNRRRHATEVEADLAEKNNVHCQQDLQ